MYFMMALLRKKLLQIDTLQYQNYEISFTKIKPFKVFTDWLINYPCVWYTKLYFEVTFTLSSMKCIKARRVHANKVLYIFPLIPWRYLFWRRKVMRTIHTIYGTAKIYEDIYFHDFLNLTWLDTLTKEMGFFLVLQRNRTRRKPFRAEELRVTWWSYLGFQRTNFPHYHFPCFTVPTIILLRLHINK